MAQINIELGDYVNAKDGSLLIKRKGKWEVTDFNELNKQNAKEIAKIKELKIEINSLKRANKHFVLYAKSHFLVVFNYFKIKVLSGDIDVSDEEILNIDEKVISGEISVEEALKKHPFLKRTYEQIYMKNETVEFPEV